VSWAPSVKECLGALQSCKLLSCACRVLTQAAAGGVAHPITMRWVGGIFFCHLFVDVVNAHGMTVPLVDRACNGSQLASCVQACIPNRAAWPAAPKPMNAGPVRSTPGLPARTVMTLAECVGERTPPDLALLLPHPPDTT